jgi:AcrR family transcriptional regulator
VGTYFQPTELPSCRLTNRGEKVLLRSSEVQRIIPGGERIDPRITRSRQMLEQAFIELLFQEGLEAVTVRDITQRAGVNRATFYAHFEDKYALFTHLIEKRLDELIQTRLPKEATFTQENLTLLVLALIEFFQTGNDSDCSSVRAQPMRPLVESRAQEQIAALLLAWLRATPNLRPRTTVAMTATLVSWTLFGLSLSYVRSGNQRADHAEISDAIGVIMYGAVDSEGNLLEGKTSTFGHSKVMSNGKPNRKLVQRKSGQGTIVT